VLKLPFLALARMLLKEGEYWPQHAYASPLTVNDCSRIEEYRERQRALELVNMVLEASGIDDTKLEEARDEWTRRCPDPGQELIDITILRECI
jgi:hypothetical protein